MPLTKQQFEELTNALVAAFPRQGDLGMMVKFKLGVFMETSRIAVEQQAVLQGGTQCASSQVANDLHALRTWIAPPYRRWHRAERRIRSKTFHSQEAGSMPVQLLESGPYGTAIGSSGGDYGYEFLMGGLRGAPLTLQK